VTKIAILGARGRMGQAIARLAPDHGAEVVLAIDKGEGELGSLKKSGASVLIVNSNFGCGSSREHAPQGLARAGFRAMIGRSFSEIFQGNSAMLGVPCFAAGGAEIERLQALVEATPEAMITVDVATGLITAGSLRVEAALPPALRDGFLSGQWNPTAMLLQDFDEVRAVAARLPYIRGF